MTRYKATRGGQIPFTPEEEAEADAREAAAQLTELDDAKAEKQTQIDALFQGQMKVLRGTVLPEEVDTFLVQEREARAWVTDNTADIPFVTALAAARGLTIAELVPRILAKADYYTDLSATVMGNKHRLEDLLDNAETVEAVHAIVVE